MTKPLKTIERNMEALIFASRWILAPFFIGLIVAMLVLLVKFGKELFSLLMGIFGFYEHDTIISILTLVDTALLAVLLIIIVFSGYENFVSKINVAADSVDRPHWMGRVDYSGLKIKLIGSLVAISVIELLKDFMMEGAYDDKTQMWRIIIHITFVISGVLFALMDFIADKREAVDLGGKSTMSEK